MRRVRPFGFGLLALLGCGEAPTSPPPATTTPMTLRCVGDREAAIPDGSGGFRCLAVGARGYGGTDSWPSVGAAASALYVLADAPAGGDGSRARPLQTLAAGLSVAPTGTIIVLGAGRHALATTAHVTTAVEIVGAGPDRTTLAVPSHEGAIVWEATGGTLRGVTLRRSTTPDASDATVGVELRAGSQLSMFDVVIDGAGIGIQAAESVLRAERVDVLASGRNGVRLMRGATGVLRSFVVRGGAAAGVSADQAHVHLREGLVDHNGAHGVAIVGAATASGGSEACEGVVDGSGEGPRDCLWRVSVQCNGIAGLYIDGARTVDAREITVWGTRRIADLPGGDGVYAQGGSRLLLDTDRTVDGEASGLRSIIGANERMGLLVDGGGTVVSARGLRAVSNASGGLFVQQAAEVSEVSAGSFLSNGAVGIGVARGATLRLLQSTRVEDTRAGEIAAVGAAGAVTLRLADGLSVADGVVTARNNALERNARFGAVFFMARGEFSGTRGEGNLYGWRAWSSTLTERANTVNGREVAPVDVVPVATGAAR